MYQPDINRSILRLGGISPSVTMYYLTYLAYLPRKMPHLAELSEHLNPKAFILSMQINR